MPIDSENSQIIVQGDDGTGLGSNITRLVDGTVNRLAVATPGDLVSTESQGRVRIAENTVVFDAYFVNSDRASSFNKKETGSGTVTRDSGLGRMELETTTANGDRAVYQSNYFHYVAGQTFIVGFTGVFGATDANCRKRMGYFDDDDGIYLEYDGTNLSFNIRTNVTGESDVSINSSSWDNQDFTFDETKYYLWQIDFLWQGAGPVSLWVFDGKNRTRLHTISNSGVSGFAYMRNPNLPIRFEIINVGTTSSAQLLAMSCVQLSTEGRQNVGIQNRSASNVVAGGKSIITGSFRPMLSIRLKSAYARGLIQILGTRILAATNDDIVFRLVKNASLTASSWTSAGADSAVEYDTSATAFSGGTILDEGFVAKSGGAPSEIAETFETIQSDFDGTADIVTVVAQSLTTNATVYAALTWTELF